MWHIFSFRVGKKIAADLKIRAKFTIVSDRKSKPRVYERTCYSSATSNFLHCHFQNKKSALTNSVV